MGQPTGLVAQATSESVQLTWNRDPFAKSYEVIVRVGDETDSVPVTEVETGSLTTAMVGYEDIDVAKGNNVEYRVIAKNSRGASPESAPASAIVGFVAPAPPEQVKAVAGDTRAALVWEASKDSFSYKVYRRLVTEQSYTQIGTAEETLFVDTTVVSGSEYLYTVAGVNPAGTGTPSVPITVTTAPANKTPQQVVQIASTFSSAVQQPVIGTPVVEFPATPTSMADVSRNWRRRWLVRFPDQAEFEIADDSGAVVLYRNLRTEEQPTSSSLTVPQVQPLVESILTQSGLTEQFGTVEAVLQTKYSSNECVWRTACRQKYQGIPVVDSHVIVTLDGNGVIQSLVAVTPHGDPTAVTENILQVQAEQLATNVLTAYSISGATFNSSGKVVVVPNGYWSNNPGTLPVTPRIAWAIFFTKGAGASNGPPLAVSVAPVAYEIWIDIDTGDVIGGVTHQVSGVRGKSISTNRKIAPSVSASLPKRQASRTVITGTKKTGKLSPQSPLKSKRQKRQGTKGHPIDKKVKQG